MKLSRIAFATAAACGALAATSALALPASSYTNTGESLGNTLNIRISGASAQDNGILGSALSLCVAGTVHRYSISNNFVFFCTPDVGTNAGQISIPTRNSTAGGPITKLAIYKYSVGGSGFGVKPVNSNNAVDGSAIGADGNQLPFLDLTKLNSLCTGTFATTTTAATFGTSLSTYVNVSCSNSSGSLTTLATTYIGVSDVEPAFFMDNPSNVTAESSYALLFGVPVSLALYTALQTQQGLGAGVTEAVMPSLTTAQLASIYTNPGQNFIDIGISAPLLSTDKMHVARRVDSSGTQKFFEALVARTSNGDPFKSCVADVDLFVSADSGLQTTSTGDNESVCLTANGPATVMAGSGGGNVRNCLINHHTGNRGAVGILTMEDKPGSSNWRFVKINGVAPTQANAAAGRYPYYAESTLNTRTAGAFATAAADGYPAFVSRLKADFSNSTTIKLINGADQTFGASGLMALITEQTGSPSPDFTGTNSVLPWTKKVGLATLNNCMLPKRPF